MGSAVTNNGNASPHLGTTLALSRNGRPRSSVNKYCTALDRVAGAYGEGIVSGGTDRAQLASDRSVMIPMRALLVVLAFELAVAAPAIAQTNATVVPSVSIGTIYDDNLFAKAKGDAGSIALMRPSLEGLLESPTLTIQSLFSFDMQRSNHADLSMLDARRHGDFDLHERATQKLTLGLGLRYDRTETPGELNLDTGILGERRIADRWEIVPSLAYHVRPRTTMTASYNGMTETLVDDIRGFLHVLRAGVARQTSTRDEVSVGYLGREFVDSLEMHRSDAVLVGWSHELAEGTRFTAGGGSARRLHAQHQSPAARHGLLARRDDDPRHSRSGRRRYRSGPIGLAGDAADRVRPPHGLHRQQDTRRSERSRVSRDSARRVDAARWRVHRLGRVRRRVSARSHQGIGLHRRPGDAPYVPRQPHDRSALESNVPAHG